jgi:hypothetical protein
MNSSDYMDYMFTKICNAPGLENLKNYRIQPRFFCRSRTGSSGYCG